MGDLSLDELTEKIIECTFRVSNALGVSFMEKGYENARAHEMRKAGLKVVRQFPLKGFYSISVSLQFE